MHGGRHGVSGLLAGADHIDVMPHHQKHLVRNHEFVIFNEITGNDENFLFRHVAAP